MLFALGAWFYVSRVIVAFQIRDAVAHDRPRGNLSDLYPRWLGARELLLHGRDPYSPEITREIQQGYYGRPLDASRPGDPQDQAAFAYPVYVVFLIAPTIFMPFTQVQLLFTALLWFVTGLSVLLWLRVVGWKPPLHILAAIVILTLGSLPVIQAIKLQQLTLLVAALLAGCFAALASGYFVLAGILLALATIKPQLALLPVLWLMAWSFARWHERWRLLAAFSAAILALLAGAQYVLPGWIGRFIIGLRNYHAYTHNASLLQLLSTPTAGYALSGALILLTAWFCRRAFWAASDSAEFAASASLALALVVVTVPMFALYNQVLLLPPLLVLVRDRKSHSERRAGRFLFGITAILLSWPWVASLLLDLALIFFPANLVQDQWKLPFYTSFTLPIFVFMTLAFKIAKTGDSPELPCA